ncbi:MAG: tetratricopeptide repeat protein [Bacteroidota bacterium]
MKWTLVIGILFLAFARSFAGEQQDLSPKEQLAFANEAFEAGQADVAILAYEQLLDAGHRSVGLYFNLGNAYYETDQLAKAIINYERALLINRSEADVVYNLSIARAKAEDEIQPLPPFFLVSWWRFVRDGISSTVWSILSIMFLWAAAGGLISWMLSSSRSRKKLGFIIGLGFLFLSVIPIIMGAQRTVTEQKSDFAIVLSAEIPLNVAPTDISVVLLKLHEGTKVEVLDTIGPKPCAADNECWYKVRLANGEIGWLPFGEIELI